MMRRIGATVLAISLGVVLAFGHTDPARTSQGWPLCQTEDSTWCIWIGSIQGNGTGSTVLNFGEGSE